MELALEHVLEFQKQFKIIYNPNRELLLCPEDECNQMKFICTTIRPTQLPYTDLYEWDRCAKFISDYLEYEELDTPDRLPEMIPSPANVIEWKAGDCFDCSIVLCSLLIGCGYDAYCVYGAAPKYITTKDESKMDVPFSLELPDEKDEDVDSDEERMNQKREEESKIKGFEF